MLQLMAERIGKSKAHVIVQHADELEEAQNIKAAIARRFDCSELLVTELSSAMGIHCGPGLLAVSFYSE
jgi:fatty acid-binding protein DegV